MHMARAYDAMEEEDGDEYKGYSVISSDTITGSQERNRMMTGNAKYGYGLMMKNNNNPASGLLEDVASCVFLLTHSFFNKVTYLPFPVGSIVEAMEDAIDPLTHPLVERLEGLTLRLLASVDDKIYAVDTAVEGLVVCASGRVKLVLNLLQKRGLVGTTADLWVRHEAFLSERTHVCLDLANKVPLLRLFTPLLCAITTPLLKAISDWLVEHSQSVEKSIQYQQQGRGAEAAGELTEWGLKTGGEEMKEIKKNKTKKEEEEEVKGILDVESTTKVGTQGEEAPTMEEPMEMEKKKQQQQQQQQNKKKRAEKLEVPSSHEHEHEEEEQQQLQEKKEELSHVLEMIDSGWLLGSPTLVHTSAKGFSSSPRKMENVRSAKPRWV